MNQHTSPAPIDLPAPLVADLRASLPAVAERVIGKVVSDVPSYTEAWQGPMLTTIENAVALALTGFLDINVGAESGRIGIRHDQVLAAAYDLGRGEARAGRTMDALASAYRIGTSRAWRDLSRTASDAGLASDAMARFAERVFDFLDEVSGQSVAGHADELARLGRLRDRHLTELATALLAGRSEERLARLAEQAEWRAPQALTAVLVRQSAARTVRGVLDARTLELGGESEQLEPWPDQAVLLVPGASRSALLAALAGQASVLVGPTLPWTRARESFLRTVRALDLGLLGEEDGLLDTDLHLAELVVRADEGALADLRTRVLAPLDELRPAAAEKLTETLRAWLLHQGRREEIAAALFVHPQTVRYRMGQLREVFGDRLEDPDFIRDATVALA